MRPLRHTSMTAWRGFAPGRLAESPISGSFLRCSRHCVAEWRRVLATPRTKRRRQATVWAERLRFGRSVDDLSRSYAENLLQEEARLATATPPVIQLAEILEGFFVLAALTLQLVPVFYTTTQMQPTERTNIPGPPEETQATETVAAVVPAAPQGRDLTFLSLWSALALLSAVALGSVVRRFSHRQLTLRQRLSPSPPQSLEYQDLEQSVARAFAEIAHLASQVEKLRTKLRVVSRELTSTTENSATKFQQHWQSLQNVMAELETSADKMQDVDTIIGKMQDVQLKQLNVVSAALRRLDKECKALAAKLPHDVTSESGTETEQSTVLEEVEKNR